jgi:hypothetical protein
MKHPNSFSSSDGGFSSSDDGFSSSDGNSPVGETATSEPPSTGKDDGRGANAGLDDSLPGLEDGFSSPDDDFNSDDGQRPLRYSYALEHLIAGGYLSIAFDAVTA